MNNIFSIAKQIRAKHPRMTVPASVKAAGKLMKAGKKAAVAGVKRKKKVTAKKVAGPVKKKSVTGSPKKMGGIGAISQGRKLVSEINKLETMRKREKNRALKDIIQRDINKREMALRKLKSA